MKFFALMLIASVMVSFSGQAFADGDAAAGKAVFDAKCKMCHGADGKGNAAIAKKMNLTFPDITAKETQSKPDDVLKKRVTEGGKQMKPVKGLTDEQVTNVIAYVRSIGK